MQLHLFDPDPKPKRGSAEEFESISFASAPFTEEWMRIWLYGEHPERPGYTFFDQDRYIRFDMVF